jgi:hypothetical protein
MVVLAAFTGDDYAMFFESTIVSQFQNDLIICGVIVDNLAAQSLELRGAIKWSENPAVHTISYIPCFCHTINLVFTNSIRNCPILHGVMETMDRWWAGFQTGFARLVMAETKHCPSIPKTR